ncbi:hypothetical protein N7524_006628 [Penicillium chrysogenum]|nr:hypothetical protein N7524_006628 [Penicillium chrysogenum]
MDGFNIEAFTLLGVAVIVIGLRTATRWIMVGPKELQADDYIMLVALYGLETGAAYMVGTWFNGLANNAMTLGECINDRREFILLNPACDVLTET